MDPCRALRRMEGVKHELHNGCNVDIPSTLPLLVLLISFESMSKISLNLKKKCVPAALSAEEALDPLPLCSVAK